MKHMNEQDNAQQIVSEDAADLHQQLFDARAEAERNLNGWRRSEADFQNYQKRKEQENAELIDFAREVAVAKLLPSLDTLEQALKHAPEASGQWTRDSGQDAKKFVEDYATWQSGVAGFVKQLDKALEELGVTKIEAMGQKFDPNFHEAVREVDGGEVGVVVQVYQTGFTLNGKLIRPAQVAIGKQAN